MQENGIEKAIQLGKEWMSRSVNESHDYIHASEVERHSMNIIEQLKKENKLEEGFDERLLSVAAWWHDSYKSLEKRNTMYAWFMEGYESDKIITKELDGILDHEQISIVRQAILDHCRPIWYFLVSGKYSQPSQILFEADLIELLNRDRFNRSLNKANKWYMKIAFSFFTQYKLMWFTLLHKSSYTHQLLKKFRAEK